MPSFLRFPRALIVLAVLHVSLRCASATNTCYFPAGNIASSYVPCSPTGDGGCCVSGDMCTSLGYCVSNSKGYHYRGACTDSTWFNPSCPDYCLTNANSGNSTFVNVIACNAAVTGGSWCCAYNNTNCCGTDSVYVPTFGTLFAESGTSSTSSAASSGATGTSSTTASMPSSSASTEAETKGSSHTGAIVGAAVGVPLGIAALAALGLYFRERRRRKNMASAVPEKPEPHGDYYVGSLPPPGSMSMGPEESQYQGPNEHPNLEAHKTYELPSQRHYELPTPAR